MVIVFCRYWIFWSFILWDFAFSLHSRDVDEYIVSGFVELSDFPSPETRWWSKPLHSSNHHSLLYQRSNFTNFLHHSLLEEESAKKGINNQISSEMYVLFCDPPTKGRGGLKHYCIKWYNVNYIREHYIQNIWKSLRYIMYICLFACCIYYIYVYYTYIYIFKPARRLVAVKWPKPNVPWWSSAAAMPWRGWKRTLGTAFGVAGPSERPYNCWLRYSFWVTRKKKRLKHTFDIFLLNICLHLRFVNGYPWLIDSGVLEDQQGGWWQMPRSYWKLVPVNQKPAAWWKPLSFCVFGFVKSCFLLWPVLMTGWELVFWSL